ncbi:MAG TPA: hypothetical protein VH436_05375 [Vicinamibacterales bacterium]
MIDRFLSIHVLSVASALLLIALVAIARCGLAPHNSLPHRPQAPLPLTSVSTNPGVQMQLSWKARQLACIVDPTGTGEGLKATLDDVGTVNTIDSFLFIPMYAALLLALGALGFAAQERRRTWLFLAIAALVTVAAVADWLENIGILEMTRHFAASPMHRAHPMAPDLDAMDVSESALVKWSALAVVLGLIGVQFAMARRWWSWLLAVAVCATSVLVASMLVVYARERMTFVEPPAASVERTPCG